MKKINTLKVGEHFFFKNYEWIVLDPNAEEDTGVFAIMAKAWNNQDCPFDEDGYNNYAISSLRRKLREKLLPELDEENLLPHVVDLTADNGDDLYGTITDKVFILSCDKYRKYRKHVPLIHKWMWTCTPWWIDPSAGYGSIVRVVGAAGHVGSYDASGSGGVLPACIFSNKIEI